MQSPGDDALAGAVFTGDQNVGFGRADPFDELEHRPHLGRGGDHRRRPVPLGAGAQQLVLRLQVLAAAQGPSQVDLGAQDGEEPVVLPRLLDEVAGTVAHRLDRQIDARPGRHHHDRQRIVEGAQARDQLEPLLPRGRVTGVVQVHQNGVEIAGGDDLEDLGRRGGGLGLVALRLEEEAQGLPDLAEVIGDQRPRLAGFRRGRHGARCSCRVLYPVLAKTKKRGCRFQAGSPGGKR